MIGEKRGEMWEGRRKRMNNDEEGGKRNVRSAETGGKIILPPIFENVAICMACGKEKHVNASGFCESCWVQFSHLRKSHVIHRKEGT